MNFSARNDACSVSGRTFADAHERPSFDCGEEALNVYPRTQATQDTRRHVANCIVAVEATSGQIAAYYTLSAASISNTDLPPDESKLLPRYPAVRMGRLAVYGRFQRRGLGAAILADATARVIQSDIAAFMLVVDAKNDAAVAFYQRYEFRLITGSPRTLFLPLATARKIFP